MSRSCNRESSDRVVGPGKGPARKPMPERIEEVTHGQCADRLAGEVGKMLVDPRLETGLCPSAIAAPTRAEANDLVTEKQRPGVSRACPRPYHS